MIPSLVTAFFDPRIFNYVMMGMCLCAAARWTLAGQWWQVLYWIAAGLITVAVTNGFTK